MAGVLVDCIVSDYQINKISDRKKIAKTKY